MMKKSLILISTITLSTVFFFSLSRTYQSVSCSLPFSPSSAPKITLPPENEALWQEFKNDYRDWSQKYLTNTGTLGPDRLRVVRPKNDNDTVSEGIAYGLIFSLHANDEKTFGQLWNYAKDYLNPKGLMSWNIDSQGKVLDINSAADADLDMAYALAIAASQWTNPGYDNAAKALIANLKKYDIEENTNILKPGDNWGGTEITNPSYFSPAYYEIFKDFTGDSSWDKTAASSREIIANFFRKNPDTVFLPNWLKANGDSSPKIGWKGTLYSYDATRILLRQTMAVLLYPDRPEITRQALFVLQKANHYFECLGPENIFDSYTVKGLSFGFTHNASFVGPAAAAALVSANRRYQEKIVGRLVKLDSQQYYDQSLKLWSLLILSGKVAGR